MGELPIRCSNETVLNAKNYRIEKCCLKPLYKGLEKSLQFSNKIQVIYLLERGNRMKYFEFKDPYFALISAESKEKAIELYKNVVCESEDGFEMEEVSKERAYSLIDNVADLNESELNDLKKETGLLLIDGCLL